MSAGRRDGEDAPTEVGLEVRLRRPRGERYGSHRSPAAPTPSPLRGIAAGLLAASGTALASGSLAAILDVTLGLLVVAVVGGWVIGVAVVRGTWRGVEHQPSDATHAIGAALGALAWLGSRLVDWVVSLAILPGSTLSVGERLATTPFVDWLTPQLSVLDGVQVLLLMAVAWRSAR